MSIFVALYGQTHNKIQSKPPLGKDKYKMYNNVHYNCSIRKKVVFVKN